MLVIGCPEYNSNQGIISIFREWDRLPINTLMGSGPNSFLGQSMAVMSIPGKIDTILYSEKLGTTGAIHRLEVFWNQNDDLAFEVFMTHKLIEEPSYWHFGKHFEIRDSFIYATSDSSLTSVQKMRWIPYCKHNEVLVSGTCSAVSTGSVSLGYQDSSASGCTTYD